MIPIIFFIHDPFHIILPDYLFPSHWNTAFHHFLSYNFLLQLLCYQFSVISLASASQFSNFVIQASLSLLLKLLYLLYSSCFYTSSYSPQYYSETLPCVLLSFLKLLPSPLHSSNMYLICSSPFSSHASSHFFKTPSLKCPNKFDAPTSTNSITFSYSCFLIFTSFSKVIFLLSTHVFLLSAHVFLTTFLIFLLSISSVTKACWYSPGIAFTFQINRRCSFFVNTKSIYVSFSPILNVTFLFSSPLDLVFDMLNSFSRQYSWKSSCISLRAVCAAFSSAWMNLHHLPAGIVHWRWTLGSRGGVASGDRDAATAVRVAVCCCTVSVDSCVLAITVLLQHLHGPMQCHPSSVWLCQRCECWCQSMEASVGVLWCVWYHQRLFTRHHLLFHAN